MSGDPIATRTPAYRRHELSYRALTHDLLWAIHLYHKEAQSRYIYRNSACKNYMAISSTIKTRGFEHTRTDANNPVHKTGRTNRTAPHKDDEPFSTARHMHDTCSQIVCTKSGPVDFDNMRGKGERLIPLETTEKKIAHTHSITKHQTNRRTVTVTQLSQSAQWDQLSDAYVTQAVSTLNFHCTVYATRETLAWVMDEVIPVALLWRWTVTAGAVQ